MIFKCAIETNSIFTSLGIPKEITFVNLESNRMEATHSSNTMKPSDQAAGNEQAIKIEVLDTPNISVVPFAVSLPQSKLQDLGASSPKQSMLSVLCENGIVGSVVLLKNSAIVWVGWGTIDPRSSDYEMGKSRRFGTGKSYPILKFKIKITFSISDPSGFLEIVVSDRSYFLLI